MMDILQESVPQTVKNGNKKRRKLLIFNNLRLLFVVMDGIEPPTQGFSVLCSTN